MERSNSFGSKFLSAILCLSMLLSPIVTLADTALTSTSSGSVMTVDQAVTISDAVTYSTPLFKLVEDTDEITGEQTYMFVSSCTVGEAANVLGYTRTDGTVNVSNVGEVSGQKRVFNISSDITLGDGKVITAGTYVAAPDSTRAYEWYINNYRDTLPTPSSVPKSSYAYYSANQVADSHWMRKDWMTVNASYNTADDNVIDKLNVGEDVLMIKNTSTDSKDVKYEFKVRPESHTEFTTSHRYMVMRYRTNVHTTKATVSFNPQTGSAIATTYNIELGAETNTWQTKIITLNPFSAVPYKIMLEPFGTGTLKRSGNEYIQIAYIAFFKSAADANTFANSQQPTPVQVHSAADMLGCTNNHFTRTVYGEYTRFLYKGTPGANNSIIKFPKYSAAITEKDRFAVIKYRTNKKIDGRIYPHEAEKSITPWWDGDEYWHTMIVDLSKTHVSSGVTHWSEIVSNPTAKFLRIDLSNKGAANDLTQNVSYIEFSYVAFLSSEEEALQYAAMNAETNDYTYTFENARNNTVENLAFKSNTLYVTSNTIETRNGYYTDKVTAYLKPTVGDKGVIWDMKNMVNAVYNNTKPPMPTGVDVNANMDFSYNSITSSLRFNFAVNKDNTPVYTYVKVTDASVTIPETKAWLVDGVGNVAVGSASNVDTGAVLKVMSGFSIDDVAVTPSMLRGTFNLNTPGTYTGLTVMYGGKTIYTDFTLVVHSATTLFNPAAKNTYCLVDPLDPYGTKIESLERETNYMLVDSIEAGYAHTLRNNGKNKPVTSQNVKIFEVNVDGEKQYYIDNSSDTSSVNVWLTEKASGMTEHVHKFSNETFYFFESASSTGGFLSYNQLGGQSAAYNISHNHFPSTSTLQVIDRPSNNDADIISGMLWCEIPEGEFVTTRDGVVSKPTTLSTGLGCYSNVVYYDSSTVDSGKFPSTNPQEWRGMYFAHELGTFSTRAMADSWQGVAAQNLTIYDRVYYYKQQTDAVKVTAYVDTADVAVAYGASGADITGANLVITTTIGNSSSVERVPITMDMLSMAADGKTAVKTTVTKQTTYTGLYLTYQDKVMKGSSVGFNSLTVTEESTPQYPAPGSVVITKELDNVTHNFFKTATSRIELSVTGVPVSSGADVVILLDNSGSMGVTFGATRRGYTRDALESMLKIFANGTSDIAVSVITYDGYDMINATYVAGLTSHKTNRVHANSAAYFEPDTAQFISSGFDQPIPDYSDRFVEHDKLTPAKAAEIANNYIYTGSGTNYDRGLELAYETLNFRQKQNALNGEKRDSYVVIMGDGAPQQLNYLGKDNINNTSLFDVSVIRGLDISTKWTHEYYDTHYNKYGASWMAEAIKGKTDTKYMVIDPDADPVDEYLTYVNGLGAKIYSIGLAIGNATAILLSTLILMLRLQRSMSQRVTIC